MKKPALISLASQKYFRIIPSKYPVIHFFEQLVDPEEVEILWHIESLTNERLMEEAGDIFLVPPTDRVMGRGASVVMAAFTHIHFPSRFTDGGYGVYYAGLHLETAIHETVWHRERFMLNTKEAAGELMMRIYEGTLLKSLHDIRGKNYRSLHHPENYMVSQDFAKKMRDQLSWGFVYNSVRHSGGNCVAVFRPPAVSIPREKGHLRYVWDGSKITEILGVRSILYTTRQ